MASNMREESISMDVEMTSASPIQPAAPATNYRPWTDFQPVLPGAGQQKSKESEASTEKITPHFVLPRYEWSKARKQKALEEQNRELGDDEDISLDEVSSRGEAVYVVQQKYGYAAITFAVIQTGVLILMMLQCGIAPLSLNPMLGPYPDALSEWGGKNAVNILDDGEWWRLVTPIFLHAGVVHLLGNVAVQVDLCAFFEREWGTKVWMIIYLASAVGSSILSVIFMPDTISVGSSGAVMGIFGGKLSEVIVRRFERNKTKQERIGHKVRQEQFGAVACAVTVVMLFSFIPFVDWAAHLGGLVTGFVVGIACFSLWIQDNTWKWIGVATGATLSGVLFIGSLVYMYNGSVMPAQELSDVCGYYKQFYDDYECNCQLE
mmetsp:Transcript_31260/g.47919  ORF Transcript_31260/g.47919 Transcript_31260/m.47919 type:complete len:377 (+) Transcript_31260:84-1214(+)|eukprot:CAMPEP_0195303916 /NCGR_PEP_ID=MMETSP0707-20130614/33538_1 /TAXON_ID=33640 /ORGANISM="Asterionellopsis glacialis, Strain CCMP134" /LENGTH=376 /DNA_ID=CAMNT_0040367587 /DNA_START=21 /DNA_END=1151 /DNA_ORIENTATION=+